MKRKVFLLVLVSFLGIVLIAGSVFFQTTSLHRIITSDAKQGMNISQHAQDLLDSVKSLQMDVSQAYLTSMLSDVEHLGTSITKDGEQIDLAAKRLTEEATSMSVDFQIPWEESEQVQMLSMTEASQRISTAASELTSLAKSLITSRKETVEVSAKLIKSKNALSKTFRASDSLRRYNTEAYAQLSRAAITALSSNSVRDLNFAGRGIFDEAIKFYSTAKLSSSDKAVWEDLKTQIDETLSLAMRAYASSGDYELFNEKIKNTIIHTISLRSVAKEFFQQSQISVTDKASTTRWSTVIAALITTILCLGFGSFVSRSLIQSLTSIVQNLGKTGTEVHQASNHLLQTSSKLTEGAQKSASSLEETLSALTEISSMVASNSEHASECAHLAADTRTLAGKGQAEVERLIEAVTLLSQRSRRIEEISTVIEDIAFQTNLLALNAAVEAARAGEHGRGFAVVADAVRSLAQRSATSAKDISQLIAESVATTQQGVVLANSSKEALQKIVDAIENLNTKSSAIAEASQQQSSGVSQIQSALQELDQISQTNAQSAVQTTSSSEGLSTEATNLTDLVQDLEILMGDKPARKAA